MLGECLEAMSGKLSAGMSGILSRELSEGVSERKLSGIIHGNVGGMSGGNVWQIVRIPMQDYKSLCTAVMIYGTVDNTHTQTHIHTERDSF